MDQTTKVSSFDKHFSEICGALHLHTTFSDGGITYEELIATAKEVGLDFLVVTDHMTLKGKECGFEGFHEDLFVTVGYEHHDAKTRNHYLAIGTDKVFKDLDRPEDYVDAVHKNGGIGFIAHPAEKRNYFGNLPPYPWTEWHLDTFDGIELWNQMSDWMEQLRSWKSIIRLLFPRRYIGNIDLDLLKKWDAINQKRFCSGIGGVDAHTRKIQILFFSRTIFPIKVELKGIRTHLYLSRQLDKSDSDGSKATIIKALKNGNGFISNFRRGDAHGTKIYGSGKDEKNYLPGINETELVLPSTLMVDLPSDAIVHLIKDGTIIKKQAGKTAEFQIDKPGVYRIEAYKGSNAWIYSNPFCIRK